MPRIVIHTVLYLVCLVVLISCDLFEPRTPEEPTAARGNFIPPTEPELVIDNLINAIRERNAQHYVQCFVDPTIHDIEFEFYPTQRALNQFGSFDGWTVQDERSYLENLIANVPDNATLTLSLHDGRFEGQTASEAIYTASYRLTAEHTNDGFQHYVFEGTLQFDMFADQSSNWVIFRWEDRAFEEQRSWSELKGAFKL